MKNLLNPAYLSEEKITEIRKQFESAEPCKHIALPNFLQADVANTLFDHFPKLDALKVKRKSINENKSEEYHLDRYHPQFNELRDFLNSPEMYAWMSKATGIEGLSSTYDSLGSSLLQALLAETAIPRASSSITSNSLEIPETVIFMLLGRRRA